ncbi:hypothetical protein NQ317_018108 [Molorchus minor]|uniref:Gag protein n=1 Tax=Molorchus minor TaxID=1323400 RepID=A0ABQ9JBL5_9CUCU|nr:hypothetical protein NQ317_018108 [Molorchus minor]
MLAPQLVHPNDNHPNEVFSIIPEFDGNKIALNTFLNSCSTAFDMAIGRVAELINSRNPTTWDEVKNLLESHFGDTRDLTALIQDLQRMRQLPGESPLTFVSRLQTHEAKLHASVHKQHYDDRTKTSSNSTIGIHGFKYLTYWSRTQTRASNPRDMLTAISRVRRELQLNYFENQKFGNRSNNNANQTNQRRPNVPLPPKQCSFCKRTGHTNNECRQQQNNFQNSENYQNFSKTNYQPNSQNNFQQRPYQPQQNQNFQQNRPPVIISNPNFAGQRPPLFNQILILKRINKINERFMLTKTRIPNTIRIIILIHMITIILIIVTTNMKIVPPYDYSDPNVYNHEYTDNLSNNNYDYYENEHSSQPTLVYDQDFQTGPPISPNPPETQDTNVSQLQNKIGILNLDSFDPNLNFPEQRFTDN